MVLLRFSPGAAEEENELMRLEGNGWMIERSTFPDRERFLVTMFREPQSPTAVVLDASGRVLAQIGENTGPDRFIGTAISSDGRFVIGYWEVDDGDRVLDARLVLADAQGRWSSAIDPAVRGVLPQSAPRGKRVAYTDPVTGRVHVGELEVSP